MARRSACKYIANSIDYYILSFPQRLWGNLLFDEVKGGSSNCDTLIPVVAVYHSKSPDNIKELVFSSLLEVDGKCREVIATSALGMGVNIPDVRSIIHYAPHQMCKSISKR